MTDDGISRRNAVTGGILAPIDPEDPEDLGDSAGPAILAGGIVATLFFVVLLCWAAWTRLDAAAFGEGQVIVAGNRQVVQHRYGGDVVELHVTEGQHVNAGQALIRLAGSDVLATERALAATVIDLQAQRARLRAEITNDAIRWPTTFATARPEDRLLVEDAKRLQLAQRSARLRLFDSTRGVLGEQVDQVNAQIGGYRAQAEAMAAQRSSLQAQVESTRRLADRGDVSRNTVRTLERALAELGGSNADYTARVAAAREQVAGTRRQITQAEKQMADESSALLRETQFRLNEAMPKWIAAREQLERTNIRAPVAGRVVGLRLFSVGAVVQAGQPILDIVPDAATLEVSAKFRPEDIDGVYAGRKAEIRFLSLHDRNLPILLGTVRNVSADSLTDERTGTSHFTADIVVPDDQMKMLRDVRGTDTGIRPGVPVQVTIKLHRRTALQYFLAPLGESFARSFHER